MINPIVFATHGNSRKNHELNISILLCFVVYSVAKMSFILSMVIKIFGDQNR